MTPEAQRDYLEERAAIREHEAHMPRAQAEAGAREDLRRKLELAAKRTARNQL